MKRMILTILVLAAPAAIAQTSYPTSVAGVKQALDQRSAKVTLDNVRLADFPASLSKQIGINVRMDKTVMDLMPWGPETPVTGTFENMTAGEIVEMIASGLMLEMFITSDAVEFATSDHLRRLGRRIRPEELGLYSELLALQPGTNAEDRTRLLSMIDFRIADTATKQQFETLLQEAVDLSAVQAIDRACQKLNIGWTLNTNEIIVTTPAEVADQQLKGIVSVIMTNRPLEDVVSSVARQIGLDIRFDAGALQAVPEAVRDRFTIRAEKSGRDVLESIAARTGLTYLIEEDGKSILFFAASQLNPANATTTNVDSTTPQPMPSPSTPNAQALGSDIVGQIMVPLGNGTYMAWFVRASDLPPTLLELREEQIREVVDRAVRELLEKQKQP